jgi:ankyrin repeat protein
MIWSFSITSETLTFMVHNNALRCAKVVLKGKAPELRGMHANPNCINPYGYFPIHKAADKFSCDMIKLLLRHGASVNVHTVGNDVIENLLPLHVAIENTCMHKYLEDNLSPSQSNLNYYVYKLIHLLCLPEMVCFTPLPRTKLFLCHMTLNVIVLMP